MHRGRQRRLKRRRRHPSLTRSSRRLPGRRIQPPHIRRRRSRHRHRRRTRPRPRRQRRNHRVKRRRRRRQIRSQPLPRRRSHMQRPRTRTRENPRRIDLRRQPRKVQNHHNPQPISRRPRTRTRENPRRIDLRRQPRKVQNHHNPQPISRTNGSDNQPTTATPNTHRNLLADRNVNHSKNLAVAQSAADELRICAGQRVWLHHGTISSQLPTQPTTARTSCEFTVL
ncbi:hypothetical protein DAVIS_03862 [Mycobacterium marinum]|uniref:Uncharacterized protein n=1 Tax=Mycobacterium marinum TaxID=1781 RepID=A0A3E2MSJ4_MYCMR|nr:hypothetical protein DAVIS_03862 [Mycobacterium marinum]